MKRYKIPQGVKNAAQVGLNMHKEGFNGGTETGWNRARQLIRCTYLKEDTIRTMKAWFARHSYTSQPGYKKWVQDGRPKKLKNGNKNKYRGAVAWLIWGGDSAKRWVERINID